MNSRRFFERKLKIHDSFDLFRRFAEGDRFVEDDSLIYRRFTEEFLDSIGKSKMHDSFDLSKKYKAIDDYFRVDWKIKEKDPSIRLESQKRRYWRFAKGDWKRFFWFDF